MKRCRPWLLTAVAISLFAGEWLAQEAKPPQTPAGVKALRDVEYVPGGHERQKLDLYVPEKAEGALPLVVWIHGGGWRGGSKDRCPAMPFAAKGYVVASVNYRLSQHAPFPAQIEDCKAAIRWLRANAKNYHIDTNHVGVWGASAGGHLVALLGTSGGVKAVEGSLGNPDQSSKVQAVVDWFGPADFKPIAERDANPNSTIGQLLGGAPKDNMEKAILASPITHVTKDTPPFLIMHGDKDNLVNFHQSEILEAALKKAGVEVTLVKLEGAGHGGAQFQTDEVKKQILEFFDKHLKKTTASK